MAVGRSGTGELTVNTGGTVAVNTAIAVGEGEVIGPNSEAGFGVVNIGAAGTVTIAGTGLAAGAAALTAGNYAGATGIIKVSGKAAVLNAGTHDIRLGTNTGNPASSGDGLLSVSNGGLVFAGTIVVGDTGTGDFTANIGGALATALDDGAQAGSQGNILLTGPTTGLGLNALTVGDKGLGHVAVTGGANLVVHGTVTVGNAVGATGYIALATGGHLFAQGLIDGGNGTGALTVDSASVLSITNGLTVGPTGALSLQGGNINAGQIVNNAHIAGAGAISTLGMTNNGVATAAGGLLAIAGPVTGTGVLAIAPNGALEVRGTGAGQVFGFAAPGGVLQLDNFVATGAGAITNFAPGDQIRIATAGNVSTSFNAATDALSITAAGSTHSFQMTGAHSAADFTSAVVGVDTVLAANQAINLGTGPHFLYLGAASTNDTITAPTPSVGATPNFVDIFNFAATDKLDFTAALGSTNWNGNAATVGNYLSVATSGNNAVISLSATSGGAGVAIVTLENSGPKTLAQVLAQATI